MKKLFLSALTGLLLTTACEQTPVAPKQPTAESVQQDASVSNIPCTYPGNCVSQARVARNHLGLPSFPGGLYDWPSKRAIINRTYNPRIGSVAVCNERNGVGHVAVVIRVRGSGANAIVTLYEANYGIEDCRNDRSGTATQLRIVGYRY